MNDDSGRTEATLRWRATAVFELRDAVTSVSVPGASTTTGSGEGAKGLTGEEGGEEERGGSGCGRTLGSTIKGSLGGGGCYEYNYIIIYYILPRYR